MTTPSTTRQRGFILRRHPGDVLRVCLGLLLLAVTAQFIHPGSIGTLETNVFRLVNELPIPSALYPVVWVVMQLGVIGAVPATAIAALVSRRWRLALDFAVAGGAIYFVVKLVKDLVTRGRPQALLDGVHILGEPARGLGFPSGHAAVAVALATVAAPYLGRRARRVAWVLAALVCLFRVYVGAHLPLDVVAGAALGWAAGAAAHLALGAPQAWTPLSRLQRALEAFALEPRGLEPVGEPTRRSASFVCSTRSGGELFVKVVPRERRDDDFVYRMWRVLTHREVVRHGRLGRPLHLVEHEGLVCAMAARAGARAPEIVLAGSFGNGAGLLVQGYVAGSDLAARDDASLDRAMLVDVWRQIAALRRARIAHGDLRPQSFLLDEQNRAWIVDFARAHLVADEEDLTRDVADTLVCLARMTDARDVLASAREALDDEEVDRARGLLRSGHLSERTARTVREEPAILERLAPRAVEGGGPEQRPRPAAPRRGSKRTWKVVQLIVSAAIVIGVFAYFLPTIADYGDVWATIQQLTAIEFASLFAATILNIVTYWTQMVAFMPGLTLAQAAVNNQTTTSVANTLPGGGAIAVGVSYSIFRSWGFRDSDVVLFTLNTGVWNSFLKLALPVVALAAVAFTGGASAALLVPALIGLAALVAAIACFALMLWKKEFARAIGSRLGDAVSAFRKVLRKPPVKEWGDAAVRFRKRTNTLVGRRWLAMTLSTLVSHLSLYLVLLVTLRHVGVSEQEVGWAQVLGVFALARLATAIPLSPGGLGVVEATMISGLVLAGGDRAQVVAAVLVYRALTYGLQIPLGALAYAVWQRKKSWRKAPPLEPATPAAVDAQPAA